MPIVPPPECLCRGGVVCSQLWIVAVGVGIILGAEFCEDPKGTVHSYSYLNGCAGPENWDRKREK